MTEAPKCEDCRWCGALLFNRSRVGCSNPAVSTIDLDRARTVALECGPEGRLFQPKEGKADE